VSDDSCSGRRLNLLAQRRPAPVPTLAGGVGVVLGAALTLISLRASNPWLLLVSSALLAPVLLSQLFRPGLEVLSICWSGPDRMVVGESAEQVFHIHNDGRRSTPGFRIRQHKEGFEPLLLTVPALAPGGRADLSLHRTALTRGDSATQSLSLLTSAPFGMAIHHALYSANARIIVHPAPGPVAALSGISSGDRAGGRPIHSGSQMHELREWQRGDALRQVHWRATARHDRLTVIIPEAPVRSRYAFVVIGVSGDDGWEALISSAAWTAVDAVVNLRSLVRLSCAGMPDYLGDDPAAVLDWFARLNLVPSFSDHEIPAAVEWLDAEGVAVVVATRPPTHPLPFADRLVLLQPDGAVLAL
jgi:hypothetical protein